MRLIHTEASKGWGGQEIRILKEALAMRKKGHEVFFVTEKGAALKEKACKAGFTCYEVSFAKKAWLFSLVRLLWIFHRHQVELVNTHSSLDSWLGGMAARVFGVPIVRTRHLSTAIRRGMNSRLLYGKLADFVVGTCSEILPVIAKQSGKPMEHCQMVATGVEPQEIERKLEGKNPLEESFEKGAFVVGTACFMRSWKGIETFLRAAVVLKEHPKIRWVIIGGGHQETYRAIAKQLGLEKVVHFTGHLENPFPAIKALDVFALLSTAHEGISQAILQAGYLAKPLVATPTGGLKEVCLDQKTGIQVACFSEKAVAEAVLRLYECPNLCKEFGLAAKKQIEELFTFERTAEQMEKVYNETLTRYDKKL